MRTSIDRAIEAVVPQAMERAHKRERIDVQDVVRRTEAHKLVRDLFAPMDLDVKVFIERQLKVEIRHCFNQAKDKYGRLFLNPPNAGYVGRYYIAREWVPLVDLEVIGRTHIRNSTREGISGEFILGIVSAARRQGITEYVGSHWSELAATVSADEPTDEASGGDT